MSVMNQRVLPFMVALSLGAGSILAQQGPATMGGSTSIGTGVLKFGSPVDTGISRTSAGTLAIGNGTAGNTSGTLVATGITMGLSEFALGWSGGGTFGPTTDARFNIRNSAATVGSQLKVDALPTVGSGFGTSSAVIAGSTPFAGSVNIGTGGVATTGVITFGGTAFPAAPNCTYSTQTTNAVTRGVPTTTQLTLNTTTAWTASDIVSWVCISKA